MARLRMVMDHDLRATNPGCKGATRLDTAAVIAVIVVHTSGMAAFPKYFGHTSLAVLWKQGSIGVDLFFVISGFIIAVTYSKVTKRGEGHLKDFAIRRFVRIVPLLWVAVLSYALVRLIVLHQFNLTGFWSAALLLPVSPVVPPNIWTLQHEALFYTVFALSFLSSPRLKWFILIWSLLPFVYTLSSLPPQPDHGFLATLYILAHPTNVEFCMGAVLGLLWEKYLPAFLSHVRLHPTLILSFLFACLMLANLELKLDAGFLRNTLVSGILCSSVVVIAASLACPRDTLVHRTFMLLAEASYAIYLFHPLVVSGVLAVWSSKYPATPTGVVISCTALSAIFLGLCAHFLIEKPLIRLVNQRIRAERMAGSAIAV